MSDVNAWSTTDANNNAAPPDGFPENMNYSAVNNAARAVMGAIKRYHDDIGGSLAAGGVANTYTLTLNQTYSAYFEGMRFACSIPANNTGASTMNVNAIGALAIVKKDGSALRGGELQSGGIYEFLHDGTQIQLIGHPADTVALTTLRAQNVIVEDAAGTDTLTASHDGTDVNIVGVGTTDINITGITQLNVPALGLTTPLALTEGGTGGATAAAARTSLGLEIGVDVQAYDAELTELGAISSPTGADFFIASTAANTWARRTAAQVRTSLSLEVGTDVQAFDAHLLDLAGLAAVGGADQFMVSSGAGAWAYETAAQVRTTLGVVVGTDVQAQDAHLQDIADIAAPTGADQMLVSTAAGVYALESGATLRGSIGANNAGNLTAGSIPNARVPAAAVTQHEGSIDHDALLNFVANEHRLITVSTAAPSGGANGDVWLRY